MKGRFWKTAGMTATAIGMIYALYRKEKNYQAIRDMRSASAQIRDWNKKMAFPYDSDKTADTGNAILSEHIRLGRDCGTTNINSNVLVIGAAGTGKTAIVYQNIMHSDGSFIVTDAMGAMYDMVRQRQIDHRRICLFDTEHPGRSIRWNPFLEIQSIKDVQTTAEVLYDSIMYNTEASDDDRILGTAFLEMAVSAAALKPRGACKALRRALTQLAASENTWNAMYPFYKSFSEDTDAASSDAPEGRSAFQESLRLGYDLLSTYADSESLSRVVHALCDALLSCMDKKVEQVIACEGSDGFDFREIYDQDAVLFVEVSPATEAYKPLYELFYFQLFKTLRKERMADPEKTHHVTFLLDEYQNVQVPDLVTELHTNERIDESVFVFVQSVPQLEEVVCGSACDFYSNFDSLVFLSEYSDYETKSFIVRATCGTDAVPKLTEEELGRINPEHALIIFRAKTADQRQILSSKLPVARLFIDQKCRYTD